MNKWSVTECVVLYQSDHISHDTQTFQHCWVDVTFTCRFVLLWPGRGYPLPGCLSTNPPHHDYRAWDHGWSDQRVWLPAPPSGPHVAVFSGQRSPSFPTWGGDPSSRQDGLCQASLLLQGQHLTMQVHVQIHDVSQNRRDCVNSRWRGSVCVFYLSITQPLLSVVTGTCVTGSALTGGARRGKTLISSVSTTQWRQSSSTAWLMSVSPASWAARTSPTAPTSTTGQTPASCRGLTDGRWLSMRVACLSSPVCTAWPKEKLS